MSLLAITGQTWFITGLGFGIVLLLLFVFVYVMKLLGWIMQPKKAKAEPVAVQQTPNEKQLAVNDSDEAAVAYALHLYYNSLHDPIETHLTIKHHATAWHIISSGN